jgi:S-DNA-T family DNA segregation ATPase FtsK/SpoIIIE
MTRRSPLPFGADPTPHDEVLDVDEVLVIPRRADPPARAPFPLVGSLAPLAVALLVWLVLQSPLAFLFALLSPVMAVAGLLDRRVGARRARRRDGVEVTRRRQAFRLRVAAFHAREIEALNRRAPSARTILERPANPFTATAPDRAVISLGSGHVRSGVRVEGGLDEDDPDARRLRSEALVLARAPVLASPPVRVAVVGARPLADAVARGYAVQLAAALSPPAAAFVVASAERDESAEHWDWAHCLPHFGDDEVRLGAVGDARTPLPSTFVVVAESLDEVPPEATVVVAADSIARVTVLRHPTLASPLAIDGDFVSVVQAEAFSDRLRRQASAALPSAGLPGSISSTELENLPDARAPRTAPQPSAGLSAPIGVGEDGDVFRLDLVEQGPHAVVAGTTGSGKSELLVTWVAALARAYDASEFTVLLVDFKGGSAFDALTGLEQCVGLITDLDPEGAGRALSSLRAEIRRRETILRHAGARDIADARLAGRLPRLVIVVDEFAAMLSEFPQLHDVFADIAARGRSLGLHLVLCTQRPSGVVRDSLLANCELRLSLRVNNAADSVAIIGSDAASTLSADFRGRCFVSAAGRAPVQVQVAHTDPFSIVGRPGRRGESVRAPWLPALPRLIKLADVPTPSSGIAIGRFDLPEEQTQPVALYHPVEHGHLLVLGSAKSGKSTLLETIAHQSASVTVIGPGIEDSWDALHDTVELCRTRREQGGEHAPLVVVVDDIDSVLRRFDAEYQTELTAALTMLLRDGPSSGITFVAAAQRLAAPLSALAPLFPERIHLRFASRQEYIVAEGAAHDHDARLAAGGGHWRGARIQVAVADSPLRSRAGAARDHRALEGSPPPPRLLVVSSRPAPFLDKSNGAVPAATRLIDAGDRAALTEFSSRAGEQTWIVGTPDAWVAAWTTFSALRTTIPVYFDGCTPGDFRSLTRRRDLPPPVEPGRAGGWLLDPGGAIARFRPAEVSARQRPETKRIS